MAYMEMYNVPEGFPSLCSAHILEITFSNFAISACPKFLKETLATFLQIPVKNYRKAPDAFSAKISVGHFSN